MKNSNVREYPMAHDTLLTTFAESIVNREFQYSLEFSMQQLHNELIASTYDGGLLGAIHANTNDVIISDTIFYSLARPQLRPMTYNHKMMCGCAVCNTSKYSQ